MAAAPPNRAGALGTTFAVSPQRTAGTSAAWEIRGQRHSPNDTTRSTAARASHPTSDSLPTTTRDPPPHLSAYLPHSASSSHAPQWYATPPRRGAASAAPRQRSPPRTPACLTDTLARATTDGPLQLPVAPPRHPAAHLHEHLRARRRARHHGPKQGRVGLTCAAAPPTPKPPPHTPMVERESAGRTCTPRGTGHADAVDLRRVFGIFWKFARVGERLSPYVSLCCILMAVSTSAEGTVVSWFRAWID